ncbi:MAG TPA: RES family NAD+ phosphorylase [Actinomycetota bacterium]
MLYRVFPYVPKHPARREGGALFVPRQRQGTGRHDNPDRYGAMYVSREPEAAVAERIQAFRGQAITDEDLRRVDGSRYALVPLDDATLGGLVDLDDPAELAPRGLRASMVANRNRSITQAMALEVFGEGVAGFVWWSTLEASWANVTLFAERAVRRLHVAGRPEVLTVDLPVVRAAAEAIGVRLR